jgi:hypothetical protein
MLRPGYFFAQTSTGAGTGTDILKPVPTQLVSAITRSNGVFCPALSTISINITGTASVNIISNPFDDPTKDLVLTTLTASGQYVVSSAQNILINVTAVTGTVSARVVFNQELE